MLRVLITGAAGNLGSAVLTLASKNMEVYSTYHLTPVFGNTYRCNLLNKDEIFKLAEAIKPDVIIHTAMSDRTPDMASAIPLAAQNIAHAANTTGAKLVAISTDMVFDGDHPPYHENSPPSPVIPYGIAKAAAEDIISESCESALQVRTSLIYGLEKHNHQLTWMLDKIKTGEKVTLFADEVRQPIWVWNLATILLELATSSLCGILNVAGPQPVTRLDYGKKLLQAMGYSPEDHAVSVNAQDLYPHRPRNCTLSLNKALMHLQTRLIPLDEALRKAQTIS